MDLSDSRGAEATGKRQQLAIEGDNGPASLLSAGNHWLSRLR